MQNRVAGSEWELTTIEVPESGIAGTNDQNVGPTLYEPINVYKPLATNIGTVDGPFEYLTVAGLRLPLPFTTRMTVVRLENGDLILHSPIAFDERLATEIQTLGTVRHLVSLRHVCFASISGSCWSDEGYRPKRPLSQTTPLAVKNQRAAGRPPMSRATTTPEKNVKAAMIPMAHDKPNESAMMPAESAPIAYPRSRQNR
jgi:hypothetical protein